MIDQKIVELWQQIEAILCSTTNPLDELFIGMYGGKYDKEHTEILQKLLSVQEDLTLIEMRRTCEKGGDDDGTEI